MTIPLLRKTTATIGCAGFRLLAACSLIVMLLLVHVSPSITLAQEGVISVTATNTAKISLTIYNSTALFGNIAPDGSGATGAISSVVGSVGNQGAYYVWSPPTTPHVRVQSNKVWNGTVRASENSGTSPTVTVDSGALRNATTIPGSYSVAGAATAMTTAPAAWVSNQAKGVSNFTHYYALRVDWDDDPGTFVSTITYSVSQ